MPTPIPRRTFLGQAAAGSAAVTWASTRTAAESPAGRIVVGVMGLKRGKALALTFADRPGVEVRYVCDADQTRADGVARALDQSGTASQPIQDFRHILDDAEVDALVCAAPNHWHAPATLLATAAGKHVYVEKPCSHNPQEGEWMVQAARKYHRAVQLGTQRRSSPGVMEAVRKIHDGMLGRVYLVRCWYQSLRGPVGHAEPSAPPPYLDYELWQGPAPRRPFRTNVVHYNWHWNWHWGNGELGNNGVHTLDLGRWMLQGESPQRVTSSGGRYRYDDDQQTPDTHTVCFEFPGRKSLTWQGLSCNKHSAGFITCYGEDGTLELDGDGGHRIYDTSDKLVEETPATGRGEVPHIDNFLAAIRTDRPLELNAEIAEGHKSTLLCHLGNIAHRTGHTLDCDPQTGRILDDEEATALWQREYHTGWAPPVPGRDA